MKNAATPASPAGFTLIELLVVIAIIAILVGMLMPSLWQPMKQPACRHNLKGNVTFVDGHVETWGYSDFKSNKNDLFGENAL